MSASCRESNAFRESKIFANLSLASHASMISTSVLSTWGGRLTFSGAFQGARARLSGFRNGTGELAWTGVVERAACGTEGRERFFALPMCGTYRVAGRLPFLLYSGISVDRGVFHEESRWLDGLKKRNTRRQK